MMTMHREVAADLHRFWITFENPPEFSALGLGCGITAFNYEDAIHILTSSVFHGKHSLLTISSVLEDVDVRELDKEHVLPNMGIVAVRGVWFPQGY